MTEELSENNQTAYEADHFGLGLALSPHLIIATSPLKQCVYTYFRPQSVSNSYAPPKPPPSTNYTITPEPTAPGSFEDRVSQGLPGWAIAVIVVASFFVASGMVGMSWLLMQRHHRGKVMKALEESEADVQTTEDFGSGDLLMATPAL